MVYEISAFSPVKMCSHDLCDEWVRCCVQVRFPTLTSFSSSLEGKEMQRTSNWSEENVKNEDDDCDQQGAIPFVNLLELPQEVVEWKHCDPRNYSDKWMSNAAHLYDSVQSMSNMIRRKARDYADCDFLPRLPPSSRRNYYSSWLHGSLQSDASPIKRLRVSTSFDGEERMTDGDKALLETTVLGFVASTANQIEMLRKQIIPMGSTSFKRRDLLAHRGSIVAILLQVLRQDVANPMEQLQKMRRRQANELRRNPLAVRPPSLLLATNDGRDNVYESVEKAETVVAALESSIMTTELEIMEDQEFWSTYMNDDISTRSIRRQVPADKRPTTVSESADFGKTEDLDTKLTPKVKRVDFMITGANEKAVSSSALHDNADKDGVEERGVNLMGQLQQEHLQLQAAVQNSDLENIQRMEERMMEITALLGQFSNLISEQQEDVLLVHENTKSTKDNMERGQDKLVDATERGRKSQHLMARLILAMAAILLFFNWITP